MSELKAYTYDDMIDGDADTNIEYYPKSEADKVIAEKDKVIAYAQALVLKDIEIIRHQKYKRCMDNARWCKERYTRYNFVQKHSGFDWSREIDFYFRWHKRWLELAGKFKDKEAK